MGSMLAFLGLAYSFYPYVVPERLTIWEKAAFGIRGTFSLTRSKTMIVSLME